MTTAAASGSAGAEPPSPDAAPLVSILIRSMDRTTLDRAIASATAQTWPNLEIVVAAACGARHRALPATIGERRLRLVVAPGGAALDRPRAANLLLDSAHGEWLNFLDDDDEFLPHHVETLMAAARTSRERLLYSRAAVKDADGNTTGHSGIAGFHAQLYFQNRATPASTLFHRSLVDDGVRFDPAFSVYEDRDFMIACATRTLFRFVDSVTCIWHAHIGDSGLNHGGDNSAELGARYEPVLRAKWKAHFDRWLAEPGALLFLGQHHLRVGDPAEALPYLEEALRLAPNDVNALNLGGMANLRAGRIDRADVLMRRALRLLPGHPGLRENMRLIDAARTQR